MASPKCYSKSSAPVGNREFVGFLSASRFAPGHDEQEMPNDRSREAQQEWKVVTQEMEKGGDGSFVQDCVRKMEDKMERRKRPSAPVEERDKSASSTSSPIAVSSSHANWLQQSSLRKKQLEELGTEAYLTDVVRKMDGYSASSTPDKMDERDQLSIDKIKNSSKKLRKTQEGIFVTNNKLLKKEDVLCWANERYEKSLLEPADMVCQPCTFRPGQSILQWWAAWMKDCDTLGSAPKSYNNQKGTKFKRPAWFSGEVAAGPFEDSIVYADVPYKGECYQVY